MGYYAQAKKLEEMPTMSLSTIVSQVTFPVFSQPKDDRVSLRAAHFKCVHATNFINIPLMSLLIVIAQPLILFLFTDKWLDSVPYFQILCVSGLANCLQSINYQLYVAMGHSKSMFKWNLLKRSVGIMLILVGSLMGVKGILWGMVIGFWFTYFVNARLAGSITGYTLGKQLYEMLPIALVTLVSCVCTGLLGNMIPWHYILTMIVQVIVFIILYIALSGIFKIQAFGIYKTIMEFLADPFRKFKTHVPKLIPIGIGGVIGSKFTWPKKNPNVKGDGYLLTPEKEALLKKWVGIYNDKKLSTGEYMNLYDKNIVTLGCGYRFKNAYVDLAYMLQMQEGDFYPFYDTEYVNPAAKATFAEHTFAMTIGVRF